jgi:hypothetical protein
VQPPDAPAPGYRITEDRSISMVAANGYALALTAPVLLALGGAFVLAWGGEALWGGVLAFFAPAVFFPALVLGILAHEGLHGLAWRRAARLPPGSVMYGFQWKTITPYAHAKVPMAARAYRIGAAVPGIALGIFPTLLGIATGHGALAVFGLFFTLAAGGDAAILWLLRGVPAATPVMDHPSRAGCYVVAPEPAPLADASGAW